MKKISSLTSAGLIMLSLTSCATIMSGSTQKVNLSSNPPGASCRFNNELGSGVTNTPATIVLERTHNVVNLDCTLPNYGTGQDTYQPWPNLWILANVLNLGIGYFYDVYTGSAWSYVSEMKVQLVPTQRVVQGDFSMQEPKSSNVVPQVPVPLVNEFNSQYGTQPGSMQQQPYYQTPQNPYAIEQQGQVPVITTGGVAPAPMQPQAPQPQSGDQMMQQIMMERQQMMQGYQSGQ